jgi:hypothetical protein
VFQISQPIYPLIFNDFVPSSAGAQQRRLGRFELADGGTLLPIAAKLIEPLADGKKSAAGV